MSLIIGVLILIFSLTVAVGCLRIIWEMKKAEKEGHYLGPCPAVDFAIKQIEMVQKKSEGQGE